MPTEPAPRPWGSGDRIAPDKNLLEAIVAALPIGLTIQDLDFNIVYQNSQLASVFGRLGEKCYRVYEGRESVCPGCPVQLAVADGECHTTERLVTMPSGEEGFWENTACPIRDAEGKIVACLEIASNVTERKQLERQLLQSQKMEVMGQLAGGISHDFNNLLTAMKLQLDSLKAGRSNAERAVADLRALVEQASAVTGQLLAFSRRQGLTRAPHDIKTLVESFRALVARLLGERVELTLVGPPSPLVVVCDAVLVQQALMNLCLNARDAMPTGGRLTISVDTVATTDSGHQHAQRLPGRYVRFRVTDTGQGIEPAHLAHVFEPFFTTKVPGHGTGLGLAVVYGVAKQHGGWVDAASTPGEGATFDLHLPLIEGQAEPALPPARPLAPAAGGKRILLVEDEELLRELAAEVLVGLGFQVTVAASGHQALERWREAGGAFDVLFTDMVMPGTPTGVELCHMLLLERPSLRVIVTSGHSEAEDARRLPPGAVNFLPKPYDEQQLADAIGAVVVHTPASAPPGSAK